MEALTRFFEIEAAFGEHPLLQQAAANLVLCPGDATEVVAKVQAMAGQLQQQPVQLLIAAVLLQRGDQPAAFLAELERCRAIMRKLDMRRAEAHETVAILALRIRNELASIPEAQIERLRDIYEEMKRHHWLLTGPEDYPTCAFLVGQVEHSPAEIARRAHSIYEGLRFQADYWRGDPLQTASNTLALGSVEPAELVLRFYELAVAFDQAGRRIRQGEYDEVAALSLLARPAEKVVETVLGYRKSIRERWPDRAGSFTLAANLAFVHLISEDPELGALVEAKTLLDMQTIVAARQAASQSD
jgi:hypothetical protein